MFAYVAPAPAGSPAALAPVVEDIAPAPSVFRAEQAHVDVCIASAPAVTYTASAPMDDGIGSALAVILTPVLRKKRQPARLPKKQRRANTSAEVDGVRDGNRLPRAVYKFRAPAAWAAFPCVVCAREAQRARHVRGDPCRSVSVLFERTTFIFFKKLFATVCRTLSLLSRTTLFLPSSIGFDRPHGVSDQ